MEESAKHNVHAHYLLKALIDELQIKVTDEEVEQISKKQTHSKNPKTGSEDNTRHNIIWGLSVNKVLNSLLEKAEVLESSNEEKPVSTEKPASN